MAKNTSFSVGQHFASFIDAQLTIGRYSSASDVVRAGLRLLEEREAKLTALQGALIEGENSAPSNLDVLDVWAEVKEHSRVPIK